MAQDRVTLSRPPNRQAQIRAHARMPLAIDPTPAGSHAQPKAGLLSVLQRAAYPVDAAAERNIMLCLYLFRATCLPANTTVTFAISVLNLPARHPDCGNYSVRQNKPGIRSLH